jgi:multiple sugar transport system ATP-binding protein
VTHDQVEAMTMGDRVAVLKDGLLQQVATPRELYETPKNVFVAGFIGSPAMNLIQLPIVTGGVQFGSTVIPVDAKVLSKTKAKVVTVGIRPENLTVSKGEGIKVHIDVVEELGADGYLYGTTEIDGVKHDIVSRVDGKVHPNAGEVVSLKPEGGIVHLFDVESGDRLN